MATRKRGPLRIDLTGLDGAAKIDAEYNPIVDKYFVRIGKKRFAWTANGVRQVLSAMAGAAEKLRIRQG